MGWIGRERENNFSIYSAGFDISSFQDLISVLLSFSDGLRPSFRDFVPSGLH